MTTSATERYSLSSLYASVREYLQELAESGVEGIPVDQGQGARGKGQERPQPEMPEVVSRGTTTAVDASWNPEPVSLPRNLAPLSLEAVRQELGDCRRCQLAATRTNLVFGSGNPKAYLLFVGEAPGADEDLQGEPFVGEAGQILTRIITAMGLSRQEVYICNVLKCRPPGNRNPHKDEIELCSPFLLKQVQAIQPKVIVALGTFAAQTLTGTKEAISVMRGRFHDFHGIPLMPTFHPSFLLRNRGDKQRYWEVWEDMTQVLRKLGLPVPEKQGPGKQGQGARGKG